MTITADIGGKNYVLGRGRLFFDPFTAAQIAAGITAATQGSGEIYIGNTPEMSQSTSEDTLDHYDSDEGTKTKDGSVSLQVNRTGKFKTDNMAGSNLAMYFLNDAAGSVTQSAATGATFTITGARPGRFYQIGATAQLPTGVRKVSNVAVGKGASFGTAVLAANNWQVDEATGRIYILPGSTDILENSGAGTDIRITFDVAAGTREQIISKSSSVYGALRFISANPTGTQRDYYFPYVKLSPDGDFALKGDTWQDLSFKFEALAKGSSVGSLYIDGRQA